MLVERMVTGLVRTTWGSAHSADASFGYSLPDRTVPRPLGRSPLELIPALWLAGCSSRQDQIALALFVHA